MEEKIEEFKRFHKIETDIDLPFKIKNDRLFTFYNDRWVQLSQERNPKKYYRSSVIALKYSVELCKKLGMMISGYSRERYLKNREYQIKASKKYYHKVYQDPVRYEKYKEKCRELAKKYYAKKKAEKSS